MSFTFENQGTHTYLVYAVQENDTVDSMSLGMLTNNKIPGLTQTIFTQMDATKYIKYDVSAKVSVKQFFAGQVNKKRLVGVFNGIVDAMLSAEDYMIDINTILLDYDYIFADVSTCETVLICLPLVSETITSIDLGSFFKNIMFSTQFDQTENCDHVAKIINYLNSAPVFSLEDFKKILDSLSSSPDVQEQKAVKTTVQQPVVKQQPVAPQQQSHTKKVDEQQKPTLSTVQTQSATTPKIQTPVVESEPAQSNQPEKKITMMDLLMHYSKENVALYKTQKEAKKTGEKTQIPSQKEQKKQNATPNSSFPIPGQEEQVSNQSFAIPGQEDAPIQTTVQQKPITQSTQPVAPATNQTKQTPNSAGNSGQQPTYTPRQVPQGQSANFGETTVLRGGAIGETTVLNMTQTPAQMIAPHLIRKKNNEKISLNKPIFRIGKERSYVDYFIGDNTAISRSHANVITREGTYFVVDTNSTNHTFVNGTMINSNEEIQINHGDTIRLANEDFDFKIY